MIKPDVIRRLFEIAIHLKRDVDFFQRPVGLVRIIRINVVCLVAYGQADVMDLVSDALHVPDKMIPRLGGEGCTGYDS